MPYIETLENRVIATTPREIFKEMAKLLELDITKYKISFKQAGADTVGVNLPVWSNEGRLRKKRWWEVGQHPDQLNLPFQLYQPATILRREYVTHRREIHVRVQYTYDDGNAQRRTLRCNDGSCNANRNNVIALQLHKIARKFIPDATEPEVRMGLTILTAREGASLLRVAGTNGLDIQPDGVAIDQVTGDIVGTDFQLLSGGTRLNASGEPLQAYKLRLRDGELLNCYIERRKVRQLRPGRPTGEECRRMVSQAARRGMVITSTGRVYDKESGELVGTDACINTSPQRLMIRGDLSIHSPSSVTGDVRLLNGQTYGFWIESHLLECVVSANYFAPTQMRDSRE